MEAVEDVQGGLVDSTASEQASEQVVEEQQDESHRIEGRDGLEVAVGGPASPAGAGVDVRVKIEPVAVTLNGNYDPRQGRGIRGKLLEHLPSGRTRKRGSRVTR